MIYLFEVLEDEHVDMIIAALDKHGINADKVSFGVATTKASSFEANKLIDYLKERGGNVKLYTPLSEGPYETASVLHTSVNRAFFDNQGEDVLCYIPSLALPNENHWQGKMKVKYSNPTKDSCCKLGPGMKLLGPMILTKNFANSTEFKNLSICSVPWRDRLKGKLNQGQLVDEVPFITKREPKKKEKLEEAAS